MHLVIPFASASDDACRARMEDLALPNMQRLMGKLTEVSRDEGPETSLSPPHERALAAAWGLPTDDGRIPWAARQARAGGLAETDTHWAFITPCHWRTESGQVTLTPPGCLDLQDEEAAALQAAMAPYFAEDGIRIRRRLRPDLWLAEGAAFAGMSTASLDRVAGRAVGPWLPTGTGAGPMRRLQNEMQMLLYTHAVNDARETRRLEPVNSIWIHGTGELPRASVPDEAGAEPIVADALRQAALRADGSAWAQAWLAIDAEQGAALLERVRARQPVALTLCGERTASRWESINASWSTRLKHVFGAPRFISVQQKL